MDVRIETLPSVEVVYCRRLGPYEESAPAAWQALWAWIRARDLGGEVRGAYGFGLDDPTTTPAEALRYDACLALAAAVGADEAAGIGIQTLPGGRCAIGRMRGPYQGMPAFFGALLGDWLPASGESLDPGRPFLEIYLNDPTEVPESELLTDLCLSWRGGSSICTCSQVGWKRQRRALPAWSTRTTVRSRRVRRSDSCMLARR